MVWGDTVAEDSSNIWQKKAVISTTSFTELQNIRQKPVFQNNQDHLYFTSFINAPENSDKNTLILDLKNRLDYVFN